MLKLLRLIAETESMGDFEKTYWRESLNWMSEDQITKFTNILQREKNTLYALALKHNNEMQVMNNKPEWRQYLKETEWMTNEEQGKDILAMLNKI